MNKEQFLKELEKHLGRMPKSERGEILCDMREFFDCAAGEDEPTLCRRLGEPRKLAKEYLAQSVIANANKTKNMRSVIRAILYSAGLCGVNALYAVFVAGLGYMVAGALFIAAAATAVAAVAAFVATVRHFPENVMAVWLSVFSGGAIITAGFLICLANVRLIKAFNKANMVFLNKISENIIKEGEEK